MMTKAAKLTGVILAAGKGTRMFPFSDSLPKPILPICNRPLLALQIDLMRSLGVEDVIIVVGHLGFAIVNAVGDGVRQGVRIRYVQQDETLGMAHAIGKLEQFIDSPFLLLLGDIYLRTEPLQPMIDRVLSGNANGFLASKLEPDPDMVKRNFAIFDQPDGRVVKVIEKPRFVQSRIKGCGLYVFDQTVFDAIRRTPRTAMRDEYEITDSIQIMIDDGLVLYHSPVVTDDMNLTFPDDLLRINLFELRRQGLPHLVSEDARLPDRMVLQETIVGGGASVATPIRLSNSLMLAGARLDSTVDLDHVIVHGDKTIHCGPAASS